MHAIRPLVATSTAARLAVFAALGLSSCDARTPAKGEPMTATELTAITQQDQDAPSHPLIETMANERNQAAIFEFSTTLLQTCIEKDSVREGRAGNVLVSPLSLMGALAMVQNGARGATLDQLEDTTGFDTAALNAYLDAYRRRIGGEDIYGGGMDGDPLDVQLANSIWIKDSPSLEIDDSYLETCASRLGAAAFKAPFDASTAKDINTWVDRNTNEMIPTIIDSIPTEARLLLINALAFDSAWETPYEDALVHDATFTCEDGNGLDVRLMASHEDSYLEDDLFTGFIRPYIGYQYGFVGLLPREDVTLAQAVASLDGARLRALLRPVANTEVDAELPKFDFEYQADLVEHLCAMGVTDLFDAGKADLGSLGYDQQGPLFVGGIRHKTFIDVNEAGTKAAAATSIGFECGAAPQEPEIRRVVLDRPFIYLIIDLETSAPLFLGTAASIE